jgi:hypothetical protein
MRYLITRFEAAVIAKFSGHTNITVRYSPRETLACTLALISHRTMCLTNGAPSMTGE